MTSSRPSPVSKGDLPLGKPRGRRHLQGPLQSGPVFVIEEATAATEELVDAMARLLPLLSRTAPAPSAATLEQMVASSATTLFIARDGVSGPIVGTLTLAMFRIPTGTRAWIEDVIVSDSVQGRGCGELLTRAALDAAEAAGARTVDLTSRPSREAANRLYLKLGFKIRETNVYRYELDE
jgi:ribosomal protein S18 acetylase RimI-like enzyme